MDEVRPTKDIDLVIELDGYSDIPDLDKQLFKKGFAHCTQKGAPLCRYRVEGLIVDIMPTRSDVWGFTNRWYEEGLKDVIEYRLQNNNVIKLLSLPYFLASKMEAFSARGKDDIVLSHDLQDISTILAHTKSFNELYEVSDNLKQYFKAVFREWSSMDFIDDYFMGEFPSLNNGDITAKKIINFIYSY